MDLFLPPLKLQRGEVCKPRQYETIPLSGIAPPGSTVFIREIFPPPNPPSDPSGLTFICEEPGLFGEPILGFMT
jgi:hypothetical protein